jgi:hypothetical protein
MKQTGNSSVHILIISILFVVLFIFFTYTFLHEAGHAITGWLFGQSLTEFNINFWDFSAHVGMTGEELTRSQLTVQALAGVSLPLLVWGIFIILVPRKASFTLEILKLISSMTVINTLLAWIILPILFLFGKAPSDDVTRFLHYSQMPPLVLMLIAIIVYIRAWSLFLSKIDSLRNEFLLLSTTDREILTAGTRTVIPVMTGILMFVASSVFLLNHSAVKNPLDKLSPPQGFAVVAEIDLSRQIYSAETLAEFTVDEPAYVGVFIAVRNVNTSYFDLSVVGPDGYSSVVLHGEGYRSNRDGGLWEETLPPGVYQLVLTSNQSPGTASIFLKTP